MCIVQLLSSFNRTTLLSFHSALFFFLSLHKCIGMLLPFDMFQTYLCHSQRLIIHSVWFYHKTDLVSWPCWPQLGRTEPAVVCLVDSNGSLPSTCPVRSCTRISLLRLNYPANKEFQKSADLCMKYPLLSSSEEERCFIGQSDFASLATIWRVSLEISAA